MSDAYLAIARKYRPSTFAGIVGQEHVTRTLKNAIEGGRIHHAFLFCGARGVGKTTAARALARALNCEKGPTATPCGTCTSCVEITSGISPDLIEIDGASNNSVDDVRDLRETVHYAPTRGRYKIYLVDEVHMLSKPAFNALLKTLEEPPPHVVFIFATTEPNKILDTILSRVQRFDFKRIGSGAVVDRLREIAEAEGVGLSDDALRIIARAGEGSMRDAQSLLDKVISFGRGGQITDAQVADTLGLIDRGLLFAMLEGMVTGAPDQCLETIAAVYEYGFELSQFTGELLELLRNATLVAMAPESVRFVDAPQDEITRLGELVAGIEPEPLTRLFSALLEVHDQVSRATRPRIVLEMAVVRLATTRPVQPVGALLGRLEQLERSIRKAGGEPGPGGLGGARPRGSAPSRPSRGPSGHRAATLQRRPPEPAAPPEPPAAWDEPPGAPEPPPPIDLPPPAASTSDAWERLCTAWRKLGPDTSDADILASGVAELRGDVLRISLPAGRQLARARRWVVLRAVRDAVERCYPEGTRLEVVALPGTGTQADRDATLQREVLEDPRIQRVVSALGAELDRVTPFDGESA